ncbi:MAG: ABC transporter substrate-binding protein [Pseudomonadota bacterium]
MKLSSKFTKMFVNGLLALFAGLLLCAPVYAAGDPVAELNGIANRLIDQLKANKTNLHDNPQLVYSLADRIVVPHADIAEMAKRVLPPQTWNSATPAQRSKFEREFTTLLVHTYASALANYNDQTVHFYPVRGGYQGRSTVQVDSKIERADGPSISVNYRMVMRGSEWKLYDMSVEGISMLESFRSQFSDLLSQGNMAELINKLSSHNSGGQ